VQLLPGLEERDAPLANLNAIAGAWVASAAALDRKRAEAALLDPVATGTPRR
jgi:hypothetical protein